MSLQGGGKLAEASARYQRQVSLQSEICNSLQPLASARDGGGWSVSIRHQCGVGMVGKATPTCASEMLISVWQR